MSEEELLIKLSEVYEEVRKQKEYLKKQGFNGEQILVIGNLVANKEYLAKTELSKYKEASKRAIEYIKGKAVIFDKDASSTLFQVMFTDENKRGYTEDLLKILEVEDE